MRRVIHDQSMIKMWKKTAWIARNQKFSRLVSSSYSTGKLTNENLFLLFIIKSTGTNPRNRPYNHFLINSDTSYQPKNRKNIFEGNDIRVWNYMCQQNYFILLMRTEQSKYNWNKTNISHFHNCLGFVHHAYIYNCSVHDGTIRDGV